jgi:hypothetical protein
LTDPLVDLRPGFKAPPATPTVTSITSTTIRQNTVTRRGLRIGLIQASTVSFAAVLKTGNKRQMITFGVQGWKDAKGGMRFAFPPYGSKLLSN